MLQSLTIKNFALIDSLKVDFTKGLSIITGETGAGKSILLGGLALVLGKRADVLLLKDKTIKCVIEAEFQINSYRLNTFFEDNDLDYESLTIIRREILPSGKSRAFINDTPITLSVLNELSQQLIDVHSQHQTLELANANYQFKIIDALAQNQKYLDSYTRGLQIFKKYQKELLDIEEAQDIAKQQYDYNLHLYDELQNAKFQTGEQETLEQQLDALNNSEDIKQSLSESFEISATDETGIYDTLIALENRLSRITAFSADYKALFERVQSIKIEFNDIVKDIENYNEHVIYNPDDIEKYNDRLQLLYDLQKKHSVNSIEELQQKETDLEQKVQQVQNASDIVTKKKNELLKVEQQLNTLSKTIHNNRKKALPKFVKSLEDILTNLEMSSVKFQLKLEQGTSFLSNGKDALDFLISTNKGTDFRPIKKGTSGGEMSRIMLAVKSILSNYIELPTIIFDEIDTGVSGEISNKIAEVMLQMSLNMQVISITHLPQIAAKGQQHYKVYKTDSSKDTVTNIKRLNNKERLNEIAEMLGGKSLTDSALAHAKQLLN
jgi:DNA repair protein RecN (Recombination protein N)